MIPLGIIACPQPNPRGYPTPYGPVADLTEPSLSIMQRAGTKPAVLARMVQFQEFTTGIDRLARPLVPIASPAAFWVVRTKWTVAGPATEPVAVVVPPDTSHEVLVGMTALVLLGPSPPPKVALVTKPWVP